VRIWRTLKHLGCASLREGVYLLPADAPTSADLLATEQAIRDAGAQAHLLQLRARDGTQEAAFRALFDRSPAYAEFAQALKAARKGVKKSPDAEVRKSLRMLDRQLEALARLDFFPGPAAAEAHAGLATLRNEAAQRLAPGEPTAAARDVVRRLDRLRYQGRTWATRRRPWIDRLASAWLIQRFVDASPRFLWLAEARQCPKSALGFDFDGAAFTHMGDLVSFEVLACAFSLDDPALRRLGQLVHFIDVGGIPVDEAAGLETLIRGLQTLHVDDDALLAAALPLFDSLYAALGATP
jgi:hypothetical protein